MKLPQTITNRLQHRRTKNSTPASEPKPRYGLHRLSTPHKAFGGVALAAAVAAGAFFAFPAASQGAGTPQANMGTAPQLHVAGNELVSASGQRYSCTG